MPWKITFAVKASRDFSKLNKYSQKLIQNYLNYQVLKIDDPRKIGKPLVGELKGFWRYRVDKFRIICKIVDDELIISVIKIGHRSNIYE